MPAAEPRRRRSGGWLTGRILALLEHSAHPLGAAAIAATLRSRGGTVHDSAVFRGLQQLADAGRIDKVHLLSAYRPHKPGALSLVCPGCGTYAEADCPTVHDTLVGLGESRGYRAKVVVLEALARCRSCLSSARRRRCRHEPTT